MRIAGRTSVFCLCAFLLNAMLSGCTNEAEFDDRNIKRPDGFTAIDAELLGGQSTVWSSSNMAYDQIADWVTGDYATRFYSGNALYDRTRSSEVSVSGGKGPVYVGHSCASCHFNAGRTQPTFGTSSGFSTQLVYITKKNGTFLNPYGRVLHDQTIYGVTPEGKLSIDWEYEKGTFADGEVYELRRPVYNVTEWYTNYFGQDLTMDDIFISVRIPLRHVGMGLMMALDPNEIERLAAQSNYPEYGISGRCNYITERGIRQLGLSGNKAQHADLTVELGFSSDMGITNSRFPEEICEGQAQMAEAVINLLKYQGYTEGTKAWNDRYVVVYDSLYNHLEVSSREMEDVDLYMQSLGVPARRHCNLATARTAEDSLLTRQCLEGEKYFYEAKCHLCHTVTLHTKPRGNTLLMGTQLPWVGGQTIHPYSDFLLHDMGSEIMGVGLNDNYTSGLARGNEWRTTPLWGIGLQKKVNGHTYFLHDGRARNMNEAILWHGGEGEASKNIYRKMPKEKRSLLLKFLESL